MDPKDAVTSAVCLALALAAGGAAAQLEDARPLTMDEAVEVALAQNPDALTAEAQVHEAEAARGEVRGGFGPKVHVDANLQQWSSPYSISFAFGTGPATPFTVREAFTWLASVSLLQPITPLVGIFDQYKVQELGVDVASIKRAAARRDVAFGVVQAYYRLLEAERLAAVADASVAQLAAQDRQAQSLFANGVIAKNDRLRAALALATARQRSIQTRGIVEIAQGQLATAMGDPDLEGFAPVPFTGEPPPLDEPTVQSAEAHAVTQRLELRELDRGVDQASAGLGVAKSKLIPQITAVGNYAHTAGSPFSQVDAAYAGLVASWDAWDWGTTSSGIDAARSKVQQARLARKKAENTVRQEARQAFVDASTAHDALTVARAAVSQAEENYRIVTKKFENAAATSFDVVDAEAVLTQARGQVETALYDLLIAQAALDHATGAPLPGVR